MNINKEQQEAVDALNKGEMNDKEVLEQYVQDPQVKQRHIDAAKSLKQIFPGWFTIDQVVKKTMMKDKQMAAQLMLGLRLFNLCDARDGGKLYKHQTKFKITFTPEERLKVLEEQKQNHMKQIELLDKEILKVQGEMNSQSESEEKV